MKVEITPEINDLCYKIRGICMKVHSGLGPGFPEEYYQKALEYEFSRQNIAFEPQKVFTVFYEEVQVGLNYLDFLIEGKIILEIKSVRNLDDIHKFQVLKYLASTDLDVALLINFGQSSLQ
jgi:GxxExxY protein